MIMNLGILILSIFLTSLFDLSAQNGHPATSKNQEIRFEHIGSGHGLSNDYVTAILQDYKGFMWFGTTNGLNRYDGYSFKTFVHNPLDSTSIAHNHIGSLYEDRSGTLWVGTGDRMINEFSRATGTFTRHATDSEVLDDSRQGSVYAIIESRSGKLLAAVNPTGLFKLDQKKNKFLRYGDDRDSPGKSISGERAYSLFEDRDGIIWIGTDAGLNRLNPETETFTVWSNEPGNPNSLVHNHVLAICEISPDLLWVGTRNGLSRIRWGKDDKATITNFQNDATDPYSLGHNFIWTLYADSEQPGRLWVGTYGNGLDLYDPAEPGRFVHYRADPTQQGSLIDNTIRSVFRDNSGVVWIGTRGGLSRFVQKNLHFRNYVHHPLNPFSLSSNAVREIIEDRSGILWVGTWSSGLDRFDPVREQFTNYRHQPGNPNSLANNNINALIEENRDGKSILWLGAGQVTGGLSSFDPESGEFHHYRRDPLSVTGLNDDQIRTICQPRFGDRNLLWIGTAEGGLSKFDRKNGSFTAYLHDPGNQESLSDNYVVTVFEDRHGSLWVGTFEGGLNRFVPETGQFVRYHSDAADSNSLNDPRINSIHEDGAGRLWIATGRGLSRLEEEDPAHAKFRTFTEKEGLCNDDVVGILEDEHGNLWVSTENGLSKFDPRTLTFTNFDVADGLSSNNFSRAALKSRSGEMYFGGQTGITRFHPDSIQNNRHLPEIAITSFKVFEKEVKLDTAISEINHIELSYDEDFFSFEYAALDFRSPGKNQYAYKLEGFHKNWVYCGPRRFVSFSNLDPGNYTFRVKGANDDRLWNERGASLRITVNPPLWRTSWAYLLYLIFAISLLITGRWVLVNWKSIIRIPIGNISHYKLLGLLGKGGMGEVFKAIDVNSKKIVAIKLLNQKLLNDSENRRRLSNEGRILATFSHPNIVKVYEIGESEQHGFIAMEYLTGGTLKGYLQENFPLRLDKLKAILRQIADGLEEIHSKGIVHRDIKTANIMLDNDGNVRLMDFGLSKSPLVTTMTTIGTIIGTLGYVAPEQITGSNVDHRADIFAFGVMMYEMLTNEMPFKGENEMAIIHSIFNTEAPLPSEIRKEGLPAGWDRIIRKCMAKNPQERYQTINEVIQELEC